MRQYEATGTLSQAQITVVEALLAGKSITEAAAAAGSGRATIYRWLKEDFAFQAELNLGRREIRRTAFGALERLAAKATGCLEKAIEEGDVKSALEILKRLQILAPMPIGSDDPAELAEVAKLKLAARNGGSKLRAMEAERAASDRPGLL